MGDAQGFFAVGGGADLITGSGQGAFIGHPEKLAVVDQQHFGVRSHAQTLWWVHRLGERKT
jgi:hypothetical protein